MSDTTTIAPWQHALRHGLFPALSLEGVQSLHTALLGDDEQLCQGKTCVPMPIPALYNRPCEQACLVTLSACAGLDDVTVGEADQAFAAACLAIDTNLGEPAGCRHLLGWFDNTPRDEMRAALIPEVEAELRRRGAMETP